MRRDVQLFVNKDTEIPASISDVNLLSDNVLNTEDESVFDFENHAAIDDGKAHLTSISGSTFSMSQDSLSMQPSKKYTLKVANLEYGQEKLVTNRMFNSEQFDQWSISGITVTPNYTSSPIGDATADRLVSTANNWRVAKSVARTSGDENTFSVYAKLDTSTSTTTTRIEIYKGVSAVASSFNLSTGAISGSISNPFMENIGNGWYRIGGSYVSNGSNNIVYIYPSSSYGIAGTMFFWGAQLEDGNTLSPYVKNTSSTLSFSEYVSQSGNTIRISDTIDGTGGLNVVHTLTEGTNNLSIPFTTNANTGGIFINSETGSSTYELSIDQLDLFERVDATTYTTQVSLDLFDFEDINIVDKIKDARDIGKVFTEYSQQFTVPASPKNNELFSHFYNADVISGYDHRLKHEAVIRIGGADYKHGRISLTSSSIRNGVPYSYSIVFYGSTVTLKDLIGDDILPDLENTILDALNLEYSATSVQQLVENGLEFDDNYDLNAAPDYTEKTPDVFVPFISCDSHYFYDSADLPQVKDRVDSRNVKWGSTQTKKGIYYKDLKLAVKIKHVIKAIEQKYGIVFSDDFFNENNTAYSELCLFMHRERGGISKQLESSSDSFTLSELAIMPDNGTAIVSDQYEWRGESGASSNQDTNGWDLDYLSIVDTGRNLQGGYSNPVSYSYKIDFDVEVVGAGEYIVEIIDFSSGSNSSNNYYFIGGGDTSVSHVFNVGTQGSGANSYANYMYVKPRIKITTQSGISEYSIKNFFLTKVKANTAQVVNPDITNPWTPVIYTDPTLYEYDGENAQTLSGSGVGIQAQLPNMKVLDFLTSIFKMFNLTAYLVPKTEVSRYSGQIRVRPLDAFYLGGSEVDITEFVNTSDLIVKRNNIFSSVEYEFAPHKTLAAIKQNERTADTFGSELMNNLSRDLNAPIAFDGGKYNVKANFEKVMYERMTDQSDETTVMDIQWGWMASKDENPVLGKPLLFYPIIEDIYGTTDSSGADAKIDFDGSVYDRNGDLVTSSHTNITRYFRPSNSLRGNLQSLNFGSEFDEWYVWEGAGTNENSLFQNYHKNYLLGIYDKQSRLIDISAYLPVRIVMKLKLEDIVIIKGRKYRINSLKLNITTGESKMELMNDIAYSNINLNEPELILGGSFSNGNLFRIYDPTPNNDTVYKLYVEGVYQMDFNDGRAFLADSELGAGIYDITARKAKYYDNTTFLESEDSNIIEITI